MLVTWGKRSEVNSGVYTDFAELEEHIFFIDIHNLFVILLPLHFWVKCQIWKFCDMSELFKQLLFYVEKTKIIVG
jgi:hypothetical protein